MKIKGVAHRGHPIKCPENTITAYQAAYDLQFTHVELDVHLSKDGVPVIMHDHSIDRMTDGKGRIQDYTVQELKKFKVKGTEEIPTFEEAMNFLKGKMNVLVELKKQGELYPGIEEKVLDIIRRTETHDQARIISFDHYSLIRVRELDADIKIGALSSGLPHIFPFMKEWNCDFFGIHIKFLNPKLAEMLMENQIINSPWPIETPEEMELIKEKYPNSLITTNHLERWADFYRNNPELHV